MKDNKPVLERASHFYCLRGEYATVWITRCDEDPSCWRLTSINNKEESVWGDLHLAFEMGMKRYEQETRRECKMRRADAKVAEAKRSRGIPFTPIDTCTLCGGSLPRNKSFATIYVSGDTIVRYFYCSSDCMNLAGRRRSAERNNTPGEVARYNENGGEYDKDNYLC